MDCVLGVKKALALNRGLRLKDWSVSLKEDKMPKETVTVVLRLPERGERDA